MTDPQFSPGAAVRLHARALPGFAARLDGAIDRLRSAAATHPARIVQASSLGAEDMVITDLIARHRIALPVATLMTGKLHAETESLVAVIRDRYGIEVEAWHPLESSVIRFVALHGEAAMFRSIELRKGCCALRKTEPLSRLLAGRRAWVTGLRREQSAGRGAVPFVETDDQGRTKLNPIADWHWADVWHYIDRHAVPYNRLHDANYPSIGCAPCTRAVAVGEDLRAGRWWWEEDTARECGLHVPAVVPAIVPAVAR